MYYIAYFLRVSYQVMMLLMREVLSQQSQSYEYQRVVDQRQSCQDYAQHTEIHNQLLHAILQDKLIEASLLALMLALDY